MKATFTAEGHKNRVVVKLLEFWIRKDIFKKYQKYHPEEKRALKWNNFKVKLYLIIAPHIRVFN